MKKDTKTKKTAVTLLTVMLIALSCTALINASVTNYLSNITRVACVGDSITQESEYPSKLQKLLGTNYEVKNFGVSGSTVSVESKIPYVNQPQFKWAVEYEPNLVFILLGTNDANPEIAYDVEDLDDDYSIIVNAFQQLPSKPQIILIKSPPIFTDNCSYNNTRLVTDVIPQIEYFAEQMNLTTIDLYGALENRVDCFSDGVHPNDNGSTIIASTIYNAINDAREGKTSSK
ncbi:MAG: GDSL-type esterase/lipase family protein [Candidatus Bathyarchaeota archaeon]|nr:GDSL-type esterase/lipase family protein [Candidatus Bathyarchaeota archaeon]MDD4325353.1 GDSL-type esterase/lipase family protein [Candidatus Bathyarchaeota archaeon]MDI9576593.1 GDSL-type esterase/lipase family protein [Thermoproteota archaeon]MDT8782181.1 hypothetical protein [Candidatus Bathyarchaeota archaeon]NLD66440.1 hypothetical protein [Thermoproteota archaeon]